MQMRVLVEGVESAFVAISAPSSSGVQRRSAKSPSSASGSSTRSIRGSKSSESTQLRSACASEKPGTFGIAG